MFAYIIVQENNNEDESLESYSIIGVFRNIVQAQKAFNCYLDAMEKIIKEQGQLLVFNRFSEPTDDILLHAEYSNIRINLIRAGLD